MLQRQMQIGWRWAKKRKNRIHTQSSHRSMTRRGTATAVTCTVLITFVHLHTKPMHQGTAHPACRVKPDCTGLPCVRDTPARVPPTSTPRTQITVHFSVWSRALRPRRIRSPRFAIHAPSQLCLYPAPNNSLLALPARTASVCAC